MRTQSHDGGRVFGTSLKALYERSGSEVPPILADILRWLATRGLQAPSIFSAPSRGEAVTTLKHMYEVAMPDPLRTATDPGTVAGLLKRWLEALPDPLFGWDLQVELLCSLSISDTRQRTSAQREAIFQADALTVGTLKPLLLFLQQYCFRQQQFDDQLAQVAKAFVGSLFPAAIAAGPKELRMAEEATASLVSNALHIFNPSVASRVPAADRTAATESHAVAHVSVVGSDSHRPSGGFTGALGAQGPLELPKEHLLLSAPSLPSMQHHQQTLQHDYHADDVLEIDAYLLEPEFLERLGMLVDFVVTQQLFSSDSDTDEDDANARSTVQQSSGAAQKASEHSISASQHYGVSSDRLTLARRGVELRLGREEAAATGVICVVSASLPLTSSGSAEHNWRTQLQQKQQMMPLLKSVASDSVLLSSSAALIRQREAGKSLQQALSGGSSVMQSTDINDLALDDDALEELRALMDGASASSSPTQSGATPGVRASDRSPEAPMGGPVRRRTADGGAGLSPVALQRPQDAYQPPAPAAAGSASLPSPALLSTTSMRRSHRSQQSSSTTSGSTTAGAQPRSTMHLRSVASHPPSRRSSHGGSNGGSSSGHQPHAKDSDSISRRSRSHSHSHSQQLTLHATLGPVGSVMVGLRGQELMVWDLPNRVSPHIPVRELSRERALVEKETLKRQLKHVTTAYEAYCGRALTVGEKEILRPLYVRYHKLKTLIAKTTLPEEEQVQVQA